MNTLYPDATPEELQLSDNICIICREDMVSSSKKLPCGHIFHTICLRSWFQRQQTCPTCRLNILRTPVAVQSQPINAAAQREGVQGAAPADVLPAAANAGQAGVAAEAAIPAPQIGNNSIPPTISIPTLFNLPMPGMMMPPPFLMPPPPIPPGLDHLSEEELRLLEGTERRNVEERIKFLRNVQTLLDASSALMSQYQAISVQYPIPIPTPPSPPSQPSEEQKNGMEKENEVVAGSSSKQTVQGETEEPAAVVNVMDKVTIRDVIDEEEGESAAAQSSSPSSSAPPSPNDEHAEMRRRRLEKFAKLGD